MAVPQNSENSFCRSVDYFFKYLDYFLYSIFACTRLYPPILEKFIGICSSKRRRNFCQNPNGHILAEHSRFGV